jgi:5'-deoxynucleotidase YfbR-like HD superfamily hydrolase
MKQYWIETFNGNTFDYENLSMNIIEIEDIAHALSQVCRFNGHCRSFYSVAEHSVHVANVIDERLALAGLLHDGTEAYMPDIPTPLKAYWSKYFWLEQFEEEILKTVFKSFVIPYNEEDWKIIKKYDKAVLREERNILFKHKDLWEFPEDIPEVNIEIGPLDSEEAEQLFLEKYYELIFKADENTKLINSSTR